MSDAMNVYFNSFEDNISVLDLDDSVDLSSAASIEFSVSGVGSAVYTSTASSAEAVTFSNGSSVVEMEIGSSSYEIHPILFPIDDKYKDQVIIAGDGGDVNANVPGKYIRQNDSSYANGAVTMEQVEHTTLGNMVISSSTEKYWEIKSGGSTICTTFPYTDPSMSAYSPAWPGHSVYSSPGVETIQNFSSFYSDDAAVALNAAFNTAPTGSTNPNSGYAASSVEAETFTSEIVSMTIRDASSAICQKTLNMIYTDTKPVSMLRVVGTTGDGGYTGMHVKEGRLCPCSFVKVMATAYPGTDGVPIKYKIVQSVNINGNNTMKIRTPWADITPGQNVGMVMRLIPPTAGQSTFGGIYGDVTYRFTLLVMDKAGNINAALPENVSFSKPWEEGKPWDQFDGMVAKDIRYSSMLYRSAYQNIDSVQRLMDTTDPGSPEAIGSGSNSGGTDNYRSWEDTFFPVTHGYPVNVDGTMDEANALRISEMTNDETGELAMYDQLVLKTVTTSSNEETKEISFDQNGLCTTIWNRSKKYQPNVNSGSLSTYWVVENLSSGEFVLEFEHFDFNPSNVGEINYNSPVRDMGDILAVYDASDDNAFVISTDIYGRNHYVINESNRLRLMCVLTGSDGSYQKRSFDNQIQGDLELSEDGFKMPPITTCNRVCLIPFTNSGNNSDELGSGFKLRAGKFATSVVTNYDASYRTGEFWMHRMDAGKRNPSSVEIGYNYFSTSCDVDCESATVKFERRMSNSVTATWCMYSYLYTSGQNDYPYPNFGYDISVNGEWTPPTAYSESCLHTFAMKEDDLVDNAYPSVYAVASGDTAEGHRDSSYVYTASNQSGRLSKQYSINMDTGMLTFNTGYIPLGRVLSDYKHHTFYRITSDGYGDVNFYDRTLVPIKSDSGTTTFWTYVDLKVINEGANLITSTQMKIIPRGYVSNGTVVDTVIDVNRPWDIQEGTTAETVRCTGGTTSVSYDSLPTATPAEAYTVKGSQVINLDQISVDGTKYVRLFWTIAADANGDSFITVSKGRKTYSCELSGVYFTEYQ